jgi:hypothetical protein
MFFGLTSPCTSATAVRLRRLHERLEPRREVGVARRGREQVGLEADVEEDRVGRERDGERGRAAE